MKTFVISLNSSNERRQHIKNVMARLALGFEFFDAIDGRHLSPDLEAKLDQKLAFEILGRELTAGEAGCALSHLSLYERMVAENISEALIFEDDIDADDRFRDVLEDLTRKMPARVELVYLYNGKAKAWPMKRSLSHGFKLARYRFPSRNSRRKIIRTTAYILKSAGARKLLNNAYPVRMPSDFLLGSIHKSRINAYGVEPNPLSTDHFETTITDRKSAHSIST